MPPQDSNARGGAIPLLTASGIRSGLWVLLSVVLVGVVFVGAWTIGGHEVQVASEPLPVLGAVPDFQMTESSDRSVSRSDLLGTIWLADFVFTDCPGPCPKLSQRMLSIQRALKEKGLTARLISFTLDPERDRPEVLRQYARRFKADPDIWWFLTCDKDEVMWELATRGFFQTVIPGSDENPIQHSNYFLLVDRRGNIRAAHDGLDETRSANEIVARIIHDVEILLSEPVDG